MEKEEEENEDEEEEKEEMEEKEKEEEKEEKEEKEEVEEEKEEEGTFFVNGRNTSWVSFAPPLLSLSPQQQVLITKAQHNTLAGERVYNIHQELRRLTTTVYLHYPNVTLRTHTYLPTYLPTPVCER
ncbi:hypothetical protein Pmani_035240 [Petrolisthes manimaculis]|uniref:Uncharacterized protein n=1 Tax=Petrolisthes manimaculis TaxID=1843537 RepID=A0AAE1NKY9_9EUCA|nr:hypothetical protein Pmani_035240 [Petrolisthes manimaculis]